MIVRDRRRVGIRERGADDGRWIVPHVDPPDGRRIIVGSRGNQSQAITKRCAGIVAPMVSRDGQRGTVSRLFTMRISRHSTDRHHHGDRTLGKSTTPDTVWMSGADGEPGNQTLTQIVLEWRRDSLAGGGGRTAGMTVLNPSSNRPPWRSAGPSLGTERSLRAHLDRPPMESVTARRVRRQDGRDIREYQGNGASERNRVYGASAARPLPIHTSTCN